MRKFWGVVLIIIGALLFLSSAANTIKGIPGILKEMNSHNLGRLIGYLLAGSLFMYFSVWMIRKGSKFVKDPQKPFKDQIDELEM